MSLVGLELPGFRFHPTEEELISFYLKRIINNNEIDSNVIGFLNIYLSDPWELPGLANIGEREWHFLVPINRKHGPKGKPNRTTRNGFWKATGSDRQIRSSLEPKIIIGLKKTLVFYLGRAPKGTRTDWIMNEYRYPDGHMDHDIVLCKVYRKAISFKILEQRAMTVEEDSTKTYLPSPHQSQDMLSSLSSSSSSLSFSKNDMYFKNCEEKNHNTLVNQPHLTTSNTFVEPSKFSINNTLSSSPIWTELQCGGQDLWSLFS